MQDMNEKLCWIRRKLAVLFKTVVHSRGLTIDRIDNEGHYERGNIQFVTNAVNQSHRRKGIKYVASSR